MDIADAGRGYGSIALLCGSAGVPERPGHLAKYFSRKGHKDAGLRVGNVGSGGTTTRYCVCRVYRRHHFGIGGHRRLQLFCHWCRWRFLQPGLQAVTPNEMRGVIAGIYVVIVNLFGLALGPTSVALVTDYVFADAGAVGASMASCLCSFPPGSDADVFYFRHGRRVEFRFGGSRCWPH